MSAETEQQPTDNQAQSDRVWQRTNHANLVRYVPSGIYYARLRVKGKLIWKSFKTKVLSVAKLKLTDFEKDERQRADASEASAHGKMTIEDAIRIHKERVAGPKTSELGSARSAQEKIS